MKTIRQIADEIGVSKQAVYKRFKGKLHTVCAPYAHTERGILYISEQGEILIKRGKVQSPSFPYMAAIVNNWENGQGESLYQRSIRIDKQYRKA